MNVCVRFSLEFVCIFSAHLFDVREYTANVFVYVMDCKEDLLFSEMSRLRRRHTQHQPKPWEATSILMEYLSCFYSQGYFCAGSEIRFALTGVFAITPACVSFWEKGSQIRCTAPPTCSLELKRELGLKKMLHLRLLSRNVI